MVCALAPISGALRQDWSLWEEEKRGSIHFQFCCVLSSELCLPYSPTPFACYYMLFRMLSRDCDEPYQVWQTSSVRIGRMWTSDLIQVGHFQKNNFLKRIPKTVALDQIDLLWHRPWDTQEPCFLSHDRQIAMMQTLPPKKGIWRWEKVGGPQREEAFLLSSQLAFKIVGEWSCFTYDRVLFLPVKKEIIFELLISSSWSEAVSLTWWESFFSVGTWLSELTHSLVAISHADIGICS